MATAAPLAVGLCVAVLLAGCATLPRTPILQTVPLGELTWAGDLPVLHLRGTPYEMGYQHGSLRRREVRGSVKNILAFADRQLGIPGLGRFFARRALDQAWRRMSPHVPDRYLEELEGLADGADLSLRELQRVHALPDLTSTTCASFSAAGPATSDGRLIQIRNLDWAIQSDVQRYAALFVYHPIRGHAFVNVGWLGFIGVISGMNEAGLSVSEVGAESAEAGLDGVPMPFLLRRILEESDDLRGAVEIVRVGPRTMGYNYLFSDAKARQAVALETNRSRSAVFWMGQEPEVRAAVRVPDAIFRSDWALDPDVRDRQRASRGNPRRPGLELPFGSSAYEIRYRGQAALLERFHGRIDPEVAMAIAASIAPTSNLQSIVYAYPELWVATARGRRTAAEEGYRSVDLPELFASRRSRNE